MEGHQKQRNSWYWIRILALCLIALISWWLISLPEASTKSRNEVADAESTAANEPGLRLQSGAYDIGETGRVQGLPKEKGDFAPLPYLERLVGKQAHSINTVSLVHAIVTGLDLRIRGRIQAAPSDNFVICIYNNNLQDFLDEAPVIRRELDLTIHNSMDDIGANENSRNYQFSFGLTMQPIPGLYYFSITKIRHAEPLYVGKFYIE